MAAVKPVILLAFANDPADGVNYLRNLPEEARRIRAALEYAEAQGLCEFEVRYNATLDDILAAFQQPKLRGRIAVFHYGGHADSYDLLFQSRPGDLQRVDARGFAAFLAEQRSLQLVFLNACTTEPQIDSLLAANAQVVIATSQEVDDDVAAELADRFYSELAHGASIGASYRQAVAALRSQKGDDPSAFYAANVPVTPADEAADGETQADGAVSVEAGGAASGGFWPWLLRTRRGAEAAIEWSLPQAVGDPLFGLPPLPAKPLPVSPYQRGLEYYTRDMAELFFGRGRQIRNLYQRVTAPGRASVILYYGQSGVGKSSLLDAGLAPRLEATHAVFYARRDRALGLLGTLLKQLAAPATGASSATDSDTAAPSADPAPDPATLLRAWLAAEARLGKPLVLILDQVEEVFSRRNPDQPHELAEFAAALGALEDGQDKPTGVLLLGFRKERLAEIEAALRENRVDFAKLFLEPLDVEGIQEVFWGPVRSERLHTKYNLAVEEKLPELVAHDLTADPDSPVAPTLNILLRKLWAAAVAQSTAAPRFTVALYEQLRRDGILLDDFLRQQTAVLAQEQPDSVASGLLLDLWAFHTTSLGTSDQRDAAELKAAYGERPSLEALLLRSKELYVLADPAGDSAAGDGTGIAAGSGETRLAHDTLAPLVRRDFATSTLPGQQARRLLESRAIDWHDGRSGPLLDDAALAVIDKGLGGMRSLSEPEQRMLLASKAEQGERLRRQKLQRLTATAAMVLIIVLAAAAALFWNNQQAAEARRLREQEIARQQQQEQARNADLTRQLSAARERATAQLNESRRLAQLAEQQMSRDPVVSLHLALAALPGAADQPLASEAEHSLRQAVLESRERKFIPTHISTPDQVAVIGNRVAVGGAAPVVYDLELNGQDVFLPADFVDIQGLRWGNDGRLLGWSDSALWIIGGGEPQRFPVAVAEGDQFKCAEWQPTQQWVAVCTYNLLYAWQPASGRVITLTTAFDTLDQPTEPRSAIWSQDGRLLAGLGARLVLWDSSAPMSGSATAAQVFYEPQEQGQPVSFAYWLPDNRSLVTGWFSASADNLQLHTWQEGAETLTAVELPSDIGADGQVHALYAPDPQDGTPRLLLWSSAGLLALYSLDGALLDRVDAGPNLNGVVLSPSGERTAAYFSNGSAAIWSLADLSLMTVLDASVGFVADALTGVEWLGDTSLVLADSAGLVQVARLGQQTGAVPVITRLAGYGPDERLAQAVRVANGRLLTAAYSFSGLSSLRLWQIDPIAANPGQGLPASAEPLCGRLVRTVAPPADVSIFHLYDWQSDGWLTLETDEGLPARWQLGGAAHVLPHDAERPFAVFAPDYTSVLRYGEEADGQIWRWAENGWVQAEMPLGRVVRAAWTKYGILLALADGSSIALDPQSGQSRPLPDGTDPAGSTLLTHNLLAALRETAVELWQLGSDEPLASWPVPEGQFLELERAAWDSNGLVYVDYFSGQVYVLRADPAAHTLTEVWRSEGFSLDIAPPSLHPTLPLLALRIGDRFFIVDLQTGDTIWQNTSVAALTGQLFRTVQWSTDGQYLITQMQLPQEGSMLMHIAVWRWDAAHSQPVLLQEVSAPGMLGVSPDMQWLLAREPEMPPAQQLFFYPVFGDTMQLQEDVEASCLLNRPLSDEQRQAFLIGGS